MSADLRATLESEGYEPGTPPPGGFGGADIDADVCAQAHCVACGGRMVFYPYILRDEDGGYVSYRAVTVCLLCGDEQEF